MNRKKAKEETLLTDGDLDKLAEENPLLDFSFEDDYREEVRLMREAQRDKVLNYKDVFIKAEDQSLPIENNKCILWDLYQKGWLESQQAMRLDNWMKMERK